jgi:4-hydroxybenzoyl-CoA thioesterase
VFVYERPVRFEEVDAAQIVFFPRILAYGHEALAKLMDELQGGYAELVVKRRIGLPTVHIEVDFTAPLRFGDVARVELTVTRIGHSSCAFRADVTRILDGVKVATILCVCAVTDLSALRAIGIPDDVRRILEAHATPS